MCSYAEWERLVRRVEETVGEGHVLGLRAVQFFGHVRAAGQAFVDDWLRAAWGASRLDGLAPAR